MFKWVAKGTSSWLNVHDHNYKRMYIYIWRQRPYIVLFVADVCLILCFLLLLYMYFIKMNWYQIPKKRYHNRNRKKTVAGYECVLQGKNLTHLCHVGCFFDFYVLIHGFILIAVTTRSCLRYGFVSSVPERSDYNIISAFCEELTFCGSWQLIQFHTDITSDFCFMWWFATLIMHLYVCIFNLVCRSVTYHVQGTTSTVNSTYYKLSKFIKTLPLLFLTSSKAQNFSLLCLGLSLIS